MNKEQKVAAVEKLTDELKGADAIFAIDYRGISVPQAAELRSGLRDADARFRVVKNRLTLRAAEAAGTEDLKDHLSGPTALTLVNGDVALAAKTLSRLGGEWELLEFKGGIMDGAALDADSFQAIAKLPGRDQLNAQFAGIVASPITGLVRGLGSMVQGLALQLQAIADQGLVTGEAPKEEAPKEDSSEAPSGDSASPTEASQPDTPAGEAEDVAEGSSDGEAEEPAADSEDVAEDVSDGEADAPPTDEASEPDPDPADSPEEEPSEEEAPEGEEGGETVEGGGEGDADIGEGDAGEASESEQAGDEGNAGEEETSDETSEDSSDDKENE